MWSMRRVPVTRRAAAYSDLMCVIFVVYNTTFFANDAYQHLSDVLIDVAPSSVLGFH